MSIMRISSSGVDRLLHRPAPRSCTCIELLRLLSARCLTLTCLGGPFRSFWTPLHQTSGQACIYESVQVPEIFRRASMPGSFLTGRSAPPQRWMPPQSRYARPDALGRLMHTKARSRLSRLTIPVASCSRSLERGSRLTASPTIGRQSQNCLPHACQPIAGSPCAV